MSSDDKQQKITIVNFSKTPVVVKSPSSCYSQILGVDLFSGVSATFARFVLLAPGGSEDSWPAVAAAIARRKGERRERQQQKRKRCGGFRLPLYL
jgi:hypothetical protein